MAERQDFISVVIPARDEESAIEGLVREISAVLAARAHEIIVVDDGSTDGMPAILERLRGELDTLRVLRNARSVGQSGSVRRGVKAAAGNLIVTLDGDGQNPPDQIPVLLAPFASPAAGRLGLVQGQRAGRQDTLARRWASGFANWLRSAILKDGVRDSGCGLKAFRREVYLDLPFFDHIHRFMPAMVLREGWDVCTVDVTHRARAGGRSKYSNIGRALVGIPDLMGAGWLIRRAGRPERGVTREASHYL